MDEEDLCTVCHEEGCEGPDNHTLIRQIQPSDYRLDGFYLQAASTMLEVGAKPTEDADGWEIEDWANDVLEEVAGTLPNGFVVVEWEDYWSLWRLTPPPVVESPNHDIV